MNKATQMRAGMTNTWHRAWIWIAIVLLGLGATGTAASQTCPALAGEWDMGTAGGAELWNVVARGDTLLVRTTPALVSYERVLLS